MSKHKLTLVHSQNNLSLISGHCLIFLHPTYLVREPTQFDYAKKVKMQYTVYMLLQRLCGSFVFILTGSGPFCFARYGLKSVSGVNRLSGEGLEAKDVPGMMQGGGKWPGRWVSLDSNLITAFKKLIIKKKSY